MLRVTENSLAGVTRSAEGFPRGVLALPLPGRLRSKVAPLLAVMRHLQPPLAYSDERIAALTATDERVRPLECLGETHFWISTQGLYHLGWVGSDKPKNSHLQGICGNGWHYECQAPRLSKDACPHRRAFQPILRRAQASLLVLEAMTLTTLAACNAGLASIETLATAP